ncbi:MAG: substrate-binding domain-containing protein [Nitrospira sp.]|nr:substrate-binding domain-containing protein [Nitrospira sp.]
MKTSRRHAMRSVLWVLSMLLVSSFLTSEGLADELRGSLTVVGRGPERPVIEKLAQAFERTHIGTAVDIRWNRNFRTSEMVKAGEADLAVGGREDSDLTATPIAWDGLAMIVNFSNPVSDVTIQQAASLFSGSIRDWSELDERAAGRVRLVVRPDDQNLTEGFERALGIVGRMAEAAEPIRSDQKVLSRVSGQLDAIGYLSMKAALDAVTYGMSVRILLVDGVEPGRSTIRSGRYRVKRPVVLLANKHPSPLAQAFLDLALSPEGQLLLDDLYIPLDR